MIEVCDYIRDHMDALHKVQFITAGYYHTVRMSDGMNSAVKKEDARKVIQLSELPGVPEVIEDGKDGA